MKEQRSWTISLFFVSVSMLLLNACGDLALTHVLPSDDSGPGIKATVIDAETGQSLEGVTALEIWGDVTPSSNCYRGLSTSCYNCKGLVEVEDALSGKNGVIEFPAWSGKRGSCQYISEDEPTLLLYKPGYEALALSEHGGASDYYPPRSSDTSRFNGLSIGMFRLDHYQASEDSHVINLNEYDNKLKEALRLPNTRGCFWSEIRPAVSVLMQEERRLRAYRTYDFTLSAPWLKMTTVDGRPCGPTPEDVAQLESAADAIKPDVPTRQTEKCANPIPGGKGRDQDTNKAIIYHVVIDHTDPYFIRIVQMLPSGESGVPVSQSDLRSRLGVKAPEVVIGANGACWIVPLLPTPPTHPDAGNFYDRFAHSWEITASAFLPPPYPGHPSIVVIDSDVPMLVKTGLPEWRPGRWVLPEIDVAQPVAQDGYPAVFTFDILPPSKNIEIPVQYVH